LFERLLVEARAVQRHRAAVIPPTTPQTTQRRSMKTTYIRFLSAFFGLAALAVASRAQATDQLLVTIPHDFVVSGKTLPAGEYRINRLSATNNQELSITGIENRQGVLLVSNEVTSTDENKPTLSFEHVGDQYFLSKIETAEHIFTVPVSAEKAAAVVAKQANPAAGSSSSSSGSN
jgi:hypothetical protein